MSEEIRRDIELLGHQGRPIKCSADKYLEYRSALQDAASNWIDTGQHLRAQLALNEVRRLDNIFSKVEP